MAFGIGRWIIALTLLGFALKSFAGYITTLHPVTFSGVPVHFTAVGPWTDPFLGTFVPNQYRWDVNNDGTWDATTAIPEVRLALPPGGLWLPRMEAVRTGTGGVPMSAFATLMQPDGTAPLRVDTTGGVLPAGFVNTAPIAGIGGLAPCYYDPSVVRCLAALRGQSLDLNGAPSHDPNENVGDYIDRYTWRDPFTGDVLADTLNEQVSIPASSHLWLGQIGDRLIQLGVTDAFGATSAMQWAVLVVRDSVPVSLPSSLALVALGAAFGFAGRRASHAAQHPSKT